MSLITTVVKAQAAFGYPLPPKSALLAVGFSEKCQFFCSEKWERHQLAFPVMNGAVSLESRLTFGSAGGQSELTAHLTERAIVMAMRQQMAIQAVLTSAG
jgi:hypothetical protein